MDLTPRLEFSKVSPGAYRAMLALESYVEGCGLPRPLLELVKTRVSQLNGCGYCLDMHWKDARAAGETEQRLGGLPAWRESPYYSAQERAALEWAEAVTAVGETRVPDGIYRAAREVFSEKELVDLTLAVVAINGWNRLSVAFRTLPGSYQRK